MTAISVNGRSWPWLHEGTVAEVVARASATGDEPNRSSPVATPRALHGPISEGGFTPRIAVELNGVVVPRHRWAETPVKSGDRLELVGVVGGG